MVVRKRGKFWVIYHCHGKRKGRIFRKFRTKKKAMQVHRAIMASKARRKKRKRKRR